jgi:DNA-binding beta-propeller fold protein YncE
MVLAILAVTVQAQDKPPLKLVKTTPLPGYTGDLDHFSLDLKGNRLFLATELNKTVDVFDLKTGDRIRSIEGFTHALTLAYLPESDRLIVTDVDTSTLELVDCKTYKIINTIKLTKIVDHSALDPITRYFYAESGTTPDEKFHSISIVDTKSFKLIGEIKGLPGDGNEGMRIDQAGKRLYVNLPGSDEVGVIDLKTRQIIARWALAGGHGVQPHAVALDEANHLLFSATRKPAQINVINTDTGKVVATLPCAGVNSDIWYDSARKRIYVSGDGTATVYQQLDADHYKHLAEVPTAYRAKSSYFVPELNRLYVADSNKGKPEVKLALQVFEVQ